MSIQLKRKCFSFIRINPGKIMGRGLFAELNGAAFVGPVYLALKKLSMRWPSKNCSYITRWVKNTFWLTLTLPFFERKNVKSSSFNEPFFWPHFLVCSQSLRYNFLEPFLLLFFGKVLNATSSILVKCGNFYLLNLWHMQKYTIQFFAERKRCWAFPGGNS